MLPRMQITETRLPGVLIVEPRIFKDERGYFLETFNQPRYAAAGIDRAFVQDNHSRSEKRGVLRGLHYQLAHPQAKLVWALSGAIWDVAVDLRQGSPSFGQWFGVELDAQSKRQLFIPEGFGHGFVVLSDVAEVAYKCSDVYTPGDEFGVIYDDPELAIDWPVKDGILLSAKDQKNPSLAEAKLPTL